MFSDWTTLSVRKFYIDSNFVHEELPSLTLNVDIFTLRAATGHHHFLFVVQVRLRTEVPRTSGLTQLGIELMASRS